jgi:hypothetical protein
MQVLLKLQHSKIRARAGDVTDVKVFQPKKRNSLPDPVGSVIAPLASSIFDIDSASQPHINPSLVSLCSYDDDSDVSESIALHEVQSSTVTIERFESKPDNCRKPPLMKSKSVSEVRVPLQSGSGSSSAIPTRQSKVLARTGRCNLLDKLMQKEATADLRTILLCFRAFASRGLV